MYIYNHKNKVINVLFRILFNAKYNEILKTAKAYDKLITKN